MNEKNSCPVLLVAMTLLLFVFVGAYATAYFTRGTYLDGDNYNMRVYRSAGEANLFYPAAKIESAIAGIEIHTNYLIISN